MTPQGEKLLAESKALAPVVHMNLEYLEKVLDRMVIGTPSGDARNHLTDAHIHILAAVEIFRKYRDIP